MTHQTHAAPVSPTGMAEHEESTWLSNAKWLVIGRGIVAAMGWIGTIVIARNLDATTFGEFTFIFGLLGMMSVVTDLGVGRVALSGVLDAGDDADEFLGSYLILRAVLGLVGYVLAVGFTHLAGYSPDVVRATALAGLVILLATPSHAYELPLQAKLRMNIAAISAVIGRFGQLALICIIAIVGGSLMWFAVPFIAAEVIVLATKVPIAHRLLPITYRWRTDLWFVMLREAIPLSIGTALATIYFRVDTVMLSKLGDFEAVAVYGVAFKFIDVTHFVAISVTVPLMTVLVRSWPRYILTFRHSVRRAAGFFGLLGVVLSVHFALFGSETIRVLFGAEFVSGGQAAGVLVVAEMCGSFSILALTILTAVGRHGRYPWVAFGGLLLNIGLNLVVIPRFSFDGAAVTTLITEVFVLVCMAMLVRGVAPLRPIGLGSMVLLVPIAAVSAGVGLGVEQYAHWGIAAIAALATTAVGVFGLGVPDRFGLADFR